MSTAKDGTQAWYKHGPVYDADANCDVWGIADLPYERGEEQTMLMWVYSEADADRIIADHCKAALAEALATALKSLPFPRCYDRDCIEVGVNEGNWITFKDGHTEPHKKDCPRYFIHAALASYASNLVEAGASEEKRG